MPDKLPARFSMSRVYVSALDVAGAAPVLLPLALDLETLRALYDKLDGLFIAGGGDVSPTCYGQDRHPKSEGMDTLRDDTELHLIRWALEDNKPVLGVCRGVQALNVAAGGTLLQDLDDQWPNAIRHQYFPEKPRNYVAHDVSMVDGTRLADILGQKAAVNSFHHQAVEKVAPGLRASAYAPDGVIEAIESDDSRFVIGVQWHPESLIESDNRMYALFQTFVSQAA